jgi:hypothetical protein
VTEKASSFLLETEERYEIGFKNCLENSQLEKRTNTKLISLLSYTFPVPMRSPGFQTLSASYTHFPWPTYYCKAQATRSRVVVNTKYERS